MTDENSPLSKFCLIGKSKPCCGSFSETTVIQEFLISFLDLDFSLNISYFLIFSQNLAVMDLEVGLCGPERNEMPVFLLDKDTGLLKM
jgi:hypothetical protein